ncbi:MAG: aminotransferase class V-fold PLP-dependent enzyme, partial [Bacteroidales bacterium]
NMEYGACDRVWNFYSKQKRFDYKQLQINLPLINENEIVDLFKKNINSKTKVIFLSHIVSSTALVLPVEKLCEYARNRGIITVIDGAHCPGQIDMNLQKIGADIYVGNFHKWILTPKTSAFIYVSLNCKNY